MIRELPALTVKPVACGSCVAACCRKGVVMQLTLEEAGFMRAGGTELAEHGTDKPSKLQRLRSILGMGETATKAYELQTDCGYLTQDAETGQSLCGAYENPERPQICGAFKAGEFSCRFMRTLAGVDTPAELLAYDALTRD